MQLGWNNRGTLSVLGEIAHFDHIFRSKVVELILYGCESILILQDPEFGFGRVFSLQPTLAKFWRTSDKELIISPQAVQGAKIYGGISGLVDAIVVVLGMVIEVFNFPKHGPDGSFDDYMLDYVTCYTGMAVGIKSNAYVSALVEGNIAAKGWMVIKYRYKSVVKV